MKIATFDARPAPDRHVRHPDGRVLAAGGEVLPDTPYWRRRLADGDVTLTKKRSPAA